jgi:NADP-dependent 3-hydroxy acid dehydrogenase YdfG
MSGTLSGRIAVVTGASAGIGLAIASDLARAGAKVVINARRSEKLAEVAKAIGGAVGKPASVIGVAGDAADADVIEAMLDASTKHFGAPADLVVVNAGRGLSGSVLTSDTAQWEQMVRTNVMGAALLMRSAGTRMLDDLTTRDRANWQARPRDIIVIGSVVGRHVSPFSSMYGGTKFAVHGMTEGVRRELGPKGIRVTLVEPGFVVSEFQGVAGYKDDWFKSMVERFGPMLQPEDVARSVTFIASQPSHVHVSDVLVRPTRQEYP